MCLAGLGAIGLALLFPYVYKQRLMQRRNLCEKRQTDVATALLGFENAVHTFPGYRNLQAETDEGERRATGWVFPLLPYLAGETDPAHSASFDDVFTNHGPAGPAATRGTPPEMFVAELVCPDHQPGAEQRNSTWLAWVVNSGLPDAPGTKNIPPDWPANGVFLDYYSRDPTADYGVSLDFLNQHDGADHTLLLSENVDAGRWTDSEEPRVAFVWVANLVNGEPSPQGVLFRINRRRGEGDGTVQFARPSSYHRGGVNAVFCDSSTRFLSESMDYIVFCRLMTPAGDRVRQAGSQEQMPAAYRQEPPREGKEEK